MRRYTVNPDGTIKWIDKPKNAKKGMKVSYKSGGGSSTPKVKDIPYTGGTKWKWNPETGAVEPVKTAQKQMDDNLNIKAIGRPRSSGRPKFASAGGKISKHYKGAGNIITGRD
tara:strand:- start:485 stop:823 length:339 start_codon:yes stop_codon:yes gene_type:complete